MPFNGLQPFLHEIIKGDRLATESVLMPFNGLQPFLQRRKKVYMRKLVYVLMPFNGLQPFLHWMSRTGSVSGFQGLILDIYVKYSTM